jgi:APA family basic amino acid/polyamine antiporter
MSGPTPAVRCLKREMGLFDAMMIVMGAMIGSGIFIVSADIARTVGSPGLLLLVWLATGVVTVIGALSYGELAGMMPEAGGLYVYLREAYGPLVGFLYGWTTFLVIQTGTIAAVCVAFAKFTALLVPWFGENHILFRILGLKVSAARLLAIACIVFLTFLNGRGLKTGKRVQGVFTVAKTTALLGLLLLGILVGANKTAVRANFGPGFWQGSWTHFEGGAVASVEALSGMLVLAAIGASMVGSLFSSDSWYQVTYIAGEVRNPKKSIPLSLALGTGIVTLLYFLTNLSYMLVLPVRGAPNGATVFERGIQFAADDRVGTAAASVIFGEPAAVIMAVLIMVSTFGCSNGQILAGARVYYAMARDGLFFRRVGNLNRNSVPGTALAVQAVWASLLCLSGTYSQLLDYVIFAVLLFFILTMSGLFILRRKKPDAERPYRAWGYPVLPAIYILAAAAIAAVLLVFKTEYSFPGLLIVLLGIPVYFVWRRISKPAPPPCD